MQMIYYTVLVISTFLFSMVAIGGAYLVLSRLAMLDQPSDRSNHAMPVPTGAGLAFMVSALGFLIVVGMPGAMVLSALGLIIISFIDDVRGLPVLQRLAAQAIAIIIALTSIEGSVSQGLLPVWADYLVVGVLWLWFTNLYNFMDGIDEITTVQTVSITSALVILGLVVTDIPRVLAIESIVILTAIAAFYPWNRHPAKLFMGDSGSVPLGFIIAYLLFNLAATGHWHAALILPAYYLMDATLTLLHRAMRRQPIWQAHSEHFYQRAVRAGRSHHRVSMRIGRLNLMLIALAIASVYLTGVEALAALGAAYLLTAAQLFTFTRAPRTKEVEEAQAATAANVSDAEIIDETMPSDHVGQTS